MFHTHSRRTFVGVCLAALAAAFIPAQIGRAATLRQRPRGPHPTPRPGITGARVLTKAQLGGKAQLAALFDAVRDIPEVIDGIRCNCGCALYGGDFYSLLSCFEGKDAMAKECAVCQGQGRLVARLHKAGKSLDEIRLAVDAKFG